MYHAHTKNIRFNSQSIKLIFYAQYIIIQTRMETTKSIDGYENEDYPFSSWETFKDALLCSLQTEFFDEEYPKYYAAADTTDNLQIIKRLLKTSTAQDILDDIVDMAINSGQRYASDVFGLQRGAGSSYIIDFLLRKGAEFPWNLIFSLPEDEEFEDNITGLEHRATLIDMYSALKPDIPEEILNAEIYEDYEYDEDVPNICAGFLKAHCTYISVLAR